MGLFSRGKNKVYSFEEAKRLMQTKKYERYIPVPVEGQTLRKATRRRRRIWFLTEIWGNSRNEIPITKRYKTT